MSRIRLGTKGWCYLARCDSHADGVIKIGASTNPPDQRAKQLTASTSAATPFHILYSREVEDCTEVEAAMHRAFADRRLNENREFFRVSLYEAARTLDTMCMDTFSRFKPATPFAEMFQHFPDDGNARSLTEDEQRQCRALERQIL